MKKECEKLWATQKYLVLSKSQKIYNDIREYLKSDDVNLEILKNKISLALNLKEDKSQILNSLEHIWGYFKKQAKPDEKNKFFFLLGEYKLSKINKSEVFYFLQELLTVYPNEYLKNSSIFDFYKR